MNLQSGLVIGRIRGITVRVHWSWVFIATLVTWSLADNLYEELFPRWTALQLWSAAGTSAILFFVSILLHELSHAFVAQRYGIQVPSITLFIFGGVSNLAGEMETARQEFRVAIAGPLMSWTLALLFGAASLLIPGDIATIAAYLAFVNFVLGLFNLLPGFPLDGGRIFRSIVWARTGDLTRATRAASLMGNAIAYLLIALGVVTVVTTGSLTGIWYVFIALFLKGAADSAYQRVLIDDALKDVAVGDVMRPAPDAIEDSWTIAEVVDRHILGGPERAVLTSSGGRISGLITASDVTSVPRDAWPSTRVAEAMVQASDVVTARRDTSIIEAMRLMQEHDIDQLPVVEEGRLLGLLTRGDVLNQIEFRMALAKRRKRAS
jgi:Zn-dependent protease